MAQTEQAARYREIRRLGAGGMGTVTLAEDTVLGRLVALKRVHGWDDRRGMLRLKREAMVGASLNHPNLVFVFDAQLQDDGDVVIVMEYVEGETLEDLIRTRGALPPHEAIRVLRGIGAALDAIHQRGIVHRDVKPANFLLGGNGDIKLADLGVADVADRTRITTSGAVVGSFSYMAAEQLDGAAPSSAMDVYALSAVAYEMFSGTKARPESNPLALAHAIATQPPPDLRDVRPDLPAETAEVLKRGMSADPAQRPRTVGELVRRLESSIESAPPTQEAPRRPRVVTAPASTGEPAPPPRSKPPPRTEGPRRRRSILAPALLALAAVAVCAVVLTALSSGGGEKRVGTSSTTTASSGATKSSSAKTSDAHTRPPNSGSSHASSTTTTHSTTTPATSTPTTVGPSPSAGAGPAGAAPAAAGGSASGSPVQTVEQFYKAAAAHQYATAWALADPNLRSQVGGYSAFRNEMSSVRSVTFDRAAQLADSSPTTATVAVQTTSVQTSQTQHCSGTVQTVHNGGGWLLDRLSIGC
jgi:serine/threonine protein kinase